MEEDKERWTKRNKNENVSEKEKENVEKWITAKKNWKICKGRERRTKTKENVQNEEIEARRMNEQRKKTGRERIWKSKNE